jgi:hypothetical protein
LALQGGLVQATLGGICGSQDDLHSDLTGKPIDEKNAAMVTIKYSDARKGPIVLDVNADEVAELASKGTKQARRGRRGKEVSSGPKPIQAVGTAVP